MAIMTRALGRTGADVTILGYGAMELRGRPRGPEISDSDAGRLLNAVLDGGVNLIDPSQRVAWRQAREAGHDGKGPNAIGEGISQAIVTHDDQTLYVVDNSSLEAIRLRTGSRAVIRVPGGADSMVLSPDGTTLYVPASHDTVVPVAAATARPGRPIQLPRGQARDVTPNFLT